MGPREGFPWFGKNLTLTGQAGTPESFPDTPMPLPYGFLLLPSSQGVLRLLGLGQVTRPYSFPRGVLAGPGSHDLVRRNRVSGWSQVPLWPTVPGRKG